MSDKTGAMLKEIEGIIDDGLNPETTCRILQMLGAGPIASFLLEEARLYSEFLPKSEELPFTPRMRYLHFLWDALDKLPIAAIANFSIPFRRLIAKRLFKRCGKNFISEENVRFNFGQNIEVGDNVFFNRGCFLDSKGGISLGNSAAFGEGVFVFTHSHTESDHVKRNYKPVFFDDYSIAYSFSIILPGVKVGREAIIAARAIVTTDVEPGMVVAGSPAKAARKRSTEGHSGSELNHIWLHRAAFMDE